MAKKKRGPRGGVKHTPGRGHDRKSSGPMKRRFARKAGKERIAKVAEAKRQWAAWDAQPEEVKKLLGVAGQPKLPRPKDD